MMTKFLNFNRSGEIAIRFHPRGNLITVWLFLQTAAAEVKFPKRIRRTTEPYPMAWYFTIGYDLNYCHRIGIFFGGSDSVYATPFLPSLTIVQEISPGKKNSYSSIGQQHPGSRLPFNFTQRIFAGNLSKEQSQELFPCGEMLAISVSAWLFYDFFKTISGDEVEKLRIDAIVIHCSGLSC